MARVTIAQIKEVLEKKAGNIAATARALGVSRSTIYNRIDKNKGLKQYVEDCRAELVDYAESALRQQISQGNIAAIIFTLKTLGKGRGYVERESSDLSITLSGDIAALVKHLGWNMRDVVAKFEALMRQAAMQELFEEAAKEKLEQS